MERDFYTPEDVKKTVAALFEGANHLSSDFALVIERIADYLGSQSDTGALVVDVTPVFLSILDVGREYRAISSSVWLYQYLVSTVGASAIERRLHSEKMGGQVVGTLHRRHLQEAAAVLSRNLQYVIRQAEYFSGKTIHSRAYELRHLVAALVVPPTIVGASSIAQDPLFTGTVYDFFDFRRVMFEQLSAAPTPGEDLSAWASILGIDDRSGVGVTGSARVTLGGISASATAANSTPTKPASNDQLDELPATPEVTPVSNAEIDKLVVPGFTTDRPGIDAGDSLDVDPDVQAFARLICLKDARPPLSIGLFGGWGAGKSTFMERLEKAIDAITHAEALRRENVKAGRAKPQPTGTPEFLNRVAHIRFNAWQYSDANLWASLTTEFFDQLRAEGRGRQGRALHDKLVERVKAHVSTLAGSADATRKALADSEDALMVAEKARDDAAAKVNAVKDEVLEKSLREDLAASFDRNKKALVAVGLLQKDADPGAAIKNFADIVAKLRTLPGKLSVLGHAIWNGRYRWLVAIVFLAIIATGLTMALAPEWVAQFRGWIAGTGMLVVLGVFGKPVLVVIRLILDTTSIAYKLKEADAAAQKDLSTKEDEVRIKTKEVEARRATAVRAETALARYAGPPGSPSSPRLLHFLLNDDPETKQIEGQIGLISRARRLFQAVDEIAAEEREKDNHYEDVPERIVLYIDDLDRCSHDQVYAVLQAVHLLLAFELFVVVVGVDVAWVEEAITRQLRDGSQAQGDDEGKRRKRAIDYLQKIFQIPFWLKPLSTDGNDGGSYGRFVGALVRPVAVADLSETHEIEVTGEEVKDLAGEDGQLVFESEAGADEAADEEDIPAEEAIDEVRALATMRLDPREVDFLKYPAIGAVAAHDPRGVKRMINTYRLARARMSGEELGKLLDADDPTYPILALFAAIETGQPIEEIADVIDRDLRTEKFGATDIGEIIKARVAEQDREWRSVIEEKAPAEKVMEAATLYGRWVAVAEGLAKARIVRKTHEIFIADCRPIARLVRRYSFSRMQ